ncbi:hypothetical protein ACLOJK_033580 [Asimina triloba]
MIPTRPLISKLVSKGSVKADPLEGDVALERFMLIIEEVAELKVYKRGWKEVSKRPLAPIKEEITSETMEGPTKKKKKR